MFSAQIAFSQNFGEEFDDKEWKEQVAQLPAYPRQEDLIRAFVGNEGVFSFYIDQASIDVGKDGVIRYSVVARSEAGAENVSFEGIRCSARERKTYAFGRADRTWVQARNPAWVSISSARANPYQADLADRYFCPQRSPVFDSAAASRNLRAARGSAPGR
jgi:hypothetical protein